MLEKPPLKPAKQPKTDYGRHAAAGLLALGVLLGGATAWAAFARIASAVIATGSIVVEGKPKSVQHLDGGIVKALHVDTGDRVERDQVLLELDDTTIAANLAIYERRLREAIVQKERLTAELNGEPEFVPPTELASLLKLGDLTRSVAQQKSMMKARQLTRESQLEQFDEKIAQLMNQIEGVEALSQEKEAQISKYAEEIVAVETLTNESLAPRSQLLALQRAQAELRGQSAEQSAEAARLRNAVTETRLAKLQVDREYRERAIQELEKADQQIDEIRQQMEATRKQLARIAIRAPVTGIVHELSVFTIGGIIQPGQTVMQIVPQSGAHEVEVNVDIQSIDQVFLGQRVIVRFPAFHQRTTPELDGKVQAISPSSVVDEDRGTAFYRVAVEIPLEEMSRLEGKTLIPGMPVEAFMPIEERTVLSYLLKPLTDQFNSALREE